MSAPNPSALELRSESDFLSAISSRTSRLERALITFVRHTFESRAWDKSVRWCQRTAGQAWIHHSTKYLKHVYGLTRLPTFEREQSYILVSNHRSFFDLYVVTAELVRRGLPNRIIFPVRSRFFYDNPWGLCVNGIMSFFAMYPPIFRESQRAALNLASLSELGRLLRRGGVFAGLHPEGRRNQSFDPYALLPAQSGVGRVIHAAQVPVIPVFVNGLINNLWVQVKSNFERNGVPVVVVFGAPVMLADLLAKRGSPRLYESISERCLESIRGLGEEERAYRAALLVR